ncbi:hypothetical protein [Amycolatopsis sp. NPDC049868]|uniref:hypothetical protein n=1 Tax=Amycolatopsis sp. NPDC049868 TaxID=3363934 RepID=UPI003791F510
MRIALILGARQVTKAARIRYRGQVRAGIGGRVSGTGRRQALSIGIESFGRPTDPGLEPDLDRYPPLPFAGERSSALRTELAEHGYSCFPVDMEGLGAAELGETLRSLIKSAGPHDVLVVHLLSHGDVLASGLHAVGADGECDDLKVEEWLSRIEDFPEKRPLTLFLLDLCNSGEATRYGWRVDVRSEAARAWVIAASEHNAPAYNGFFSQAVVQVLGAIRRGELDVHPSFKYVPLGTVITRIDDEVKRLGAGGFGQRVQATLVSGEYPELPFFPNPSFQDDPVRHALSTVDDRVEPFADVRLDADHFRDRASGLGPLRGRIKVGCFTGRAEELATLSDWLDQGSGKLAVVTGGPGAGKSALLGVLVCAAHPALRQSTMDLWRHVAHRPSANDDLVAVHARQCDVREIAASIGRQLGLGELTPDTLLPKLAGRPGERPVIVLDALDEAIDPESVLHELVLPLAERCRMLVGTRPWPELADLRATADRGGLVIDLDRVTTERMRGELAAYLTELLELSPEFGDVTFGALRELFADTVAERLVTTEAGPWGGFLRAGMITHYALKSGLPREAGAITAWLAENLPLTLPDLFEAELAPARVGPLGRALMITLSCARGGGMPLSVVTRAVAAFLDGAEPGQAEVRETLRRCRYYLRTMADDDGTTLYRLFHQALADHLRTMADHRALLDRLLPPPSTSDGSSRRWHLAESYLRRHASQHAIDAGCLDELLDDAEFLVHAVPEWLGPDLARAQSHARPRVGAIYQTSSDRHRHMSAAERRKLLAIDALMHQHDDLASRLARPAGLPWLDWVPRWATGGQTEPALVTTLGGFGEIGPIVDLDCTTLDDRPVVVTVSMDFTIRLWDLREQKQLAMAEIWTYPGRVVCTMVAGRQVVVRAGDTDAVELRDLRTLRLLGQWGDPEVLFRNRRLSCAQWAGRTVAVRASTETNQLQIIDLATGALSAPRLDVNAREVLCATRGGGDVLIATGVKDSSGIPSMWICDPKTGRALIELTSWPARSGRDGFTFAVTEIDDRAVVVVVGEDVLVVLDVETGESLGDPVPCPGEAYAIHCVRLGKRVVAAISLAAEGIELWDLVRRTRIGPRLLAGGCPTALTTVVDKGRVCLVAADRLRIRSWDLAEHLGKRRRPDAHGRPIRRITILGETSPPLVVTEDNLTTRTWCLEGGAPYGALISSAEAWVYGSAPTLMGHRPVLVERDRIRHLATGHVIRALRVRGMTDFLATSVVGGRPLAMVTSQRENEEDWLVLDLERDAIVGCHTHTARISNATTAVCCGSLVAIADEVKVYVWDLSHPAIPPVVVPMPGREYGDRIRLALTNVEGRAVLAAITRWSSRMPENFGVRLFDVVTHEELPTRWPDSWKCVTAATVGETLILGGTPQNRPSTDLSGFVARYDLREHRVLDEIPMPDRVGAVAGTADGRLVVGCGSDVVVLDYGEAE